MPRKYTMSQKATEQRAKARMTLRELINKGKMRAEEEEEPQEQPEDDDEIAYLDPQGDPQTEPQIVSVPPNFNWVASPRDGVAPVVPKDVQET